MKNGQLRYESDRTASVIILTVMTVILIGCILGMSYLFEYGFYTENDNGSTAKSVAVQLYSLEDLDFAKDYFNCEQIDDFNRSKQDEKRIKFYEEKFSLKQSSFIFNIMDSSGEIVFDSVGQTNPGKTYNDFSNGAEYVGYEDFTKLNENFVSETYRINYLVIDGSDSTAKDKYSTAFRWIEIANSLKYFLFVVMFFAALIIIILLIRAN